MDDTQNLPICFRSAYDKSPFRFSISLYQAVPKEGNICISPYSISATLTLLLLGTEGETKEELEKALELSSYDDSVHKEYNSLLRKLLSKTQTGLIITMANRIFAKQGITVKPSFNENALHYYGSEVEQLDFERNASESRSLINSWIEQQTCNKIKDLVPIYAINKETNIVLANGIYFKGEWENQFDETRTKRQPFYISEDTEERINMMCLQEITVLSGESKELDCKCVDLPYKGHQLSMLIILPNKITGLVELEQKLNHLTLRKIKKIMKRQDTNVILPKFKMNSSFMLKETLNKLGVTKIFNEGYADLSGFTEQGGDGTFVSSIVHKTFLDVNEKGTEAAAATCIVVSESCAGPRPFEIKADHPFLFLIHDIETGTILFIGRFSTPT